MDLSRLIAEDVGKKFGRRFIFRHVDLEFLPGQSVAITGPNGSGKSTLLRILAGLLTPTEGNVRPEWNGSSDDEITRRVGFVAPYVNVYDSFSSVENLAFVARLRRLKNATDLIDQTLDDVGLTRAAEQLVATYSSGMKQRLKLAMAVLHDPAVLMFDEPSTNLDAAGRLVVRTIMDRFRQRDRVVLVATNVDEEASMCDYQVDVSRFT